MPRSSAPLPYAQSAAPLLPGGDARYLQTELARLQATLASVLILVPQPATVAPSSPRDGMIRLAREPWRPLSGQTADQWVWFDSTSSSWKAF